MNTDDLWKSDSQDRDIPGQVLSVEESSPLFRNNQQQPTEGEEAVKKRKKAPREHTAPKIFISIAFKILKSSHKSIRHKKILQELNKKINNSTFLKFTILSELTKTLSEFKRQFQIKGAQKLNEILSSKRHSRYKESQKIYGRMKKLLGQKSIKYRAKTYWGEFSHQQKFNKSCKQVIAFKKTIRKDITKFMKPSNK